MTQTEIDKIAWFDLPNKLKKLFKDILVDLTSLGSRITELENSSDVTTPQYSTDEIVIGKWINGKNLYQKVILGNTSNGEAFEDLSSLNIDYLVAKDCDLYIIDEDSYISLPHTEIIQETGGISVYSGLLRWYKVDNTIVITTTTRPYLFDGTSTSPSNKDGNYILTLKYTKN